MIEKLNYIMNGFSSLEGTGLVSSSGDNSTYYAWHAFDDQNTGEATAWISNSIPAWIAYEFIAPKIVTSYTVTCYNDATNGPNRAPRNWTLEVWDDSQATPCWIVLDTQTDQSGWIAGLKRTYNIPNNNAYKKYRLNISASNGDAASTGIGEIEFFGVLDRSANPGDVHYYVSQQNGNDANDGLTPATAWATITKAAQTVTAASTGDAIVHIGPGTYREQITLTNSGTDGIHRIIFAGDPDCFRLMNNHPGIVRLTASDTKDITNATANARPLTFNSKTYVEFWNMYIDGGHNNTFQVLGGNGSAIGVGNILRNVKISSRCGAGCVTCYNCTGIGYVLFQNCNCYNCIGYGCYPFRATSTGYLAYNCIAIGGYQSFSSTTSVYLTAYNCLAIGAETGYYYANTNNCMALSCNTTVSGGTHTNFKNAGSGTTTSDSALALYNIDLSNVLRGATADNGSMTSLPWLPKYDYLGAQRAINTSDVIDIGALENPDYTLDWNRYAEHAPSIRINGAGQLIFKFPVEAGRPVVKSVFMKPFVLTDLISQMSSATNTEGTASASTEQQPAWKAFNKTTADASDCWSTTNTTLTGWLKFQFNTPKVVNYYSILPQNDAAGINRAPKTWTFEGSNDGSTWTTLDTQTNITGWVNGVKKEFKFTNETAYTHYRINVTAIGTATDYLAIGELNMSGSMVAPSSYDATLRPQLVVRGLGVPERFNIPACSGGFDQVAVYFNAPVSGVMEMILTTRDSSYGAYTLFSDLV